jgi:hypothetical protein
MIGIIAENTTFQLWISSVWEMSELGIVSPELPRPELPRTLRGAVKYYNDNRGFGFIDID